MGGSLESDDEMAVGVMGKGMKKGKLGLGEVVVKLNDGQSQ